MKTHVHSDSKKSFKQWQLLLFVCSNFELVYFIGENDNISENVMLKNSKCVINICCYAPKRMYTHNAHPFYYTLYLCFEWYISSKSPILRELLNVESVNINGGFSSFFGRLKIHDRHGWSKNLCFSISCIVTTPWTYINIAFKMIQLLECLIPVKTTCNFHCWIQLSSVFPSRGTGIFDLIFEWRHSWNLRETRK